MTDLLGVIHWLVGLLGCPSGGAVALAIILRRGCMKEYIVVIQVIPPPLYPNNTRAVVYLECGAT